MDQTDQIEDQIEDQMDMVEDNILKVIQNAAQTMMFVKDTLNLISAVLRTGSNATNIPFLLTHNEQLMQTAQQELKRVLGQLQEQFQDHPSVQVLASTIAHMEASLNSPIKF